MKPILIILLSLHFSSAFSANEKTYSMQDLKALAASSSWVELAQHLDDIKPSERNEEWEKLLEKTGIGLLSNVAQLPASAAIEAGYLVDRYPQLKKSKEFMQLRADAGLKAYERCLQSTYIADECLKSLKAYLAEGPQKPEVFFDYGKMVTKNAKHWAAAPFFESAINEANSPRCKDEHVERSVISALGLPPETHPEPIKSAQAIAEKCFSTLKDKLASSLSESSYHLKNTCKLFLKEKALSGLRAKKCEKEVN